MGGVPPLPGFAFSQSATAFSAESWCGVNVGMGSRRGGPRTKLRLTSLKPNHSCARRKPAFRRAELDRAGLGLRREYTDGKTTSGRREKRHEIRHLLRVATATPMAGRR